VSDSTVIARPYAKAAFEFAKTHDLDSWLNALNLLGEVTSVTKINTILNNPLITSDERLAMLKEICEGQLDEPQQNFLAIMAENHRLYCLPAVKKLFQAFYDEYKQTIEAEVSTAFALSAAQKASLASTLEKKLKAKVELTETINPGLIGGAIVRIGDQTIDGSVKGRLQRLAHHLNLKESLCQ